MNTHHPASPSEFSANLPWKVRVFRWLMRFAFASLFNIKVEHADRFPKENCIVVANHLSWIDHLLLMTVLPAEPRPYLLGAGQSLNSGFKAWLLRNLGGVILFPRGASWVGRDTFRKPRLVLESGASLVLFPEGGVGQEEGKLLPLLRGVGHFCIDAENPVLPIALSGVRDLYFRKRIRVIVGEPFRVRKIAANRHAAIDAVTEQVRGALEGILPEYVEPNVRLKPLHFLTSLSDHL